MPRSTVLVADPETATLERLREPLDSAGLRVVGASTVREALDQCEEGVDVALVDADMPDSEGLELIERMKALDPDLPIILVSDRSSVPRAVRAIQLGAYHYVQKPVDPEKMLPTIEKALETTSLRREVRRFRNDQSKPYSFDSILGGSEAVAELRALLQKVASSPASTVLLTGESGTDKDLTAHYIHYNSARASGPFMHITCSAMPENLLESELFGHERGAFTGAAKLKRGLFELADGGTVFLDEIGEMTAALQAKLLRFLEEKALKRVGGAKDIKVDVRVVAATNRDLDRDVGKGEFREDLYYRLRVLAVHLPPLRARQGDAQLLAKFFVDHFNQEFGKNVVGFTAEAEKLLSTHDWPGNVRELRNAIERAVLLAENETLGAGDFSMLQSRKPAPRQVQLPPEGLDFKRLERDLVLQALDRVDWNRTRAAELLGMRRDQIRYRIEKFGLESGNGRSAPSG